MRDYDDDKHHIKYMYP